jgi:hypothetical protein
MGIVAMDAAISFCSLRFCIMPVAFGINQAGIWGWAELSWFGFDW